MSSELSQKLEELFDPQNQEDYDSDSEWQAEKEEILTLLQSQEHALPRLEGGLRACPCQPGRKPKSPSELLQHAKACDAEPCHSALVTFLEGELQQAAEASQSVKERQPSEPPNVPIPAVGRAQKDEIVWPPTVILENVLCRPSGSDFSKRDIYDTREIEAALREWTDQRRSVKYFIGRQGVKGQGTRGIAMVTFWDYRAAERLARQLKAERRGRQDWEQDHKSWEQGSRAHTVGPLYGYLASEKDLATLDPGKKALKWELRPHDMVTNDANLLISQVDRAEARCQEASSKADRAEREAKRAKLDHKAALTGAQAMQARMGDYQDKIEQLQSQHSHHQLKHDQQLMEMQQQSQQQMQQLQREAQAALDRQADSMRSVRHVSNTAMQRLAAKHGQQMERLRAQLQQDTGKEDLLHQQILGLMQELSAVRQKSEQQVLHCQQQAARELAEMEQLKTQALKEAQELRRSLQSAGIVISGELHQEQLIICPMCFEEYIIPDPTAAPPRCDACVYDKAGVCKACKAKEKETLKLQKSRERWLYKCGHLVCKGCLDRREQWLRDQGRKNACPTCSQDMPKSHCHAFGKVYLGG